MDKDVKSLLDGIMTFDNIPRKKPKFVNFVKNVIGGGKRCSPTTIEKVDIFLHRGIKNNILNIIYLHRKQEIYLYVISIFISDLEYF